MDYLYPKIPVVNVTPSLTFRKIVRSSYSVCSRILYGSRNKQRLFPYTALTDWFL